MSSFKIKDYSYAKDFSEMGKVLWADEKQECVIRAGTIYECPTIKGGTNLIVTYRVYDGNIYYGHGDKVRKTPLEHFARAVLNGDIQPRSPKEIDTERLELCQIALDAIAHRRTGEETIEYYGEQAAERFAHSA